MTDLSIPYIRYKAPKKAQQKSKVKPWKPNGPFHFLGLPPELRIRIYEFALLVHRTIDLDTANFKRIAPRLDLLLTCRCIYEEAYPIFYGNNIFRIFPVSGQFFSTRHVLLSRLPRHYREAITTMELRVGPGWTAPPKGWAVTRRLGLSDCKSLKFLKVMIECDPSDEIFRNFRVSKTFYTDFCTTLLENVLRTAKSLEYVEFDAYSSVPRDSPLLLELVSKAKMAEKQISWGSEINRPETELFP